MPMPYDRAFVALLESRLYGAAPLIQVLVRPRQVGKTTGTRQFLARAPGNHHYANADDLLVTNRTWLLEQWQKAIEVKSDRMKSAKGLEAFMKHFPEVIAVIVTPDNFAKLSEDPKRFLARL